MGIKKSAITRWLMAVVIIWPFGCSMIQPAVKKNMPPPAPVSRTIEPIPESQSQQAFPQEGPSLSTPKVKHFTHEIKWRGETLGSIARWYTGSAKNWVHLVEANPGIDPRSINIGDSVLIPDYLLKTRRPMPNDFLLSSTDKRKKPSTISTKQTDRSDKLELFGPINTESQTAGEIELFGPIDTESQTAGGIELFGPIAAESQTAGADDSDSAIPLETIE